MEVKLLKILGQFRKTWRPSQANYIGEVSIIKKYFVKLGEIVTVVTVTWLCEVCPNTHPSPRARPAGDEHVVRNTYGQASPGATGCLSVV